MTKQTTTPIALLLVTGLAFWGTARAETVFGAPFQLEKAVYFVTADNRLERLEAGSYLLERDGLSLRMVPAAGGDALLARAALTRHDKSVGRPIALSIPGKGAYRDVHLVALLMPGGETLRAAGTYSGVMPRGFLGDLYDAGKGAVSDGIEFVEDKADDVVDVGGDIVDGAKEIGSEIGDLVSDAADDAWKIAVSAFEETRDFGEAWANVAADCGPWGSSEACSRSSRNLARKFEEAWNAAVDAAEWLYDQATQYLRELMCKATIGLLQGAAWVSELSGPVADFVNELMSQFSEPIGKALGPVMDQLGGDELVERAAEAVSANAETIAGPLLQLTAALEEMESHPERMDQLRDFMFSTEMCELSAGEIGRRIEGIVGPWFAQLGETAPQEIPSQPEPAGPVAITWDEFRSSPDSRVHRTVSAGDIVTVSLASNASTGYVWTVTVPSESQEVIQRLEVSSRGAWDMARKAQIAAQEAAAKAAEEVADAAREAAEAAREAAEAAQEAAAKAAQEAAEADRQGKLVGGPTQQEFSFRALRGGSARVIFEYRQPWMKDEPPASRLELVLTVEGREATEVATTTDSPAAEPTVPPEAAPASSGDLPLTGPQVAITWDEFRSSPDSRVHRTVSAGDIVTVSLASNASTGYVWTATVPDESHEVIQRLEVSSRGAWDDTVRKAQMAAQEAAKAAQEAAQAAQAPVVGAPTQQEFSFQALRGGSARAIFEYRRPWMQDDPPTWRLELLLTVVGRAETEVATTTDSPPPPEIPSVRPSADAAPQPAVTTPTTPSAPDAIRQTVSAVTTSRQQVANWSRQAVQTQWKPLMLPAARGAGVELDQDWTPATRDGQGVQSGAACAQTFTVGKAGMLGKIAVRLNRRAWTDSDLIVQIRRVDDSGQPSMDPAEILFARDLPPAEFPLVFSEESTEIDVRSAGIMVQPGDRLALVLNNPGPIDYQWWHRAGYDHGQGFVLDSGRWVEHVGDFVFQTEVASGEAARVGALQDLVTQRGGSGGPDWIVGIDFELPVLQWLTEKGGFLTQNIKMAVAGLYGFNSRRVVLGPGAALALPPTIRLVSTSGHVALKLGYLGGYLDSTGYISFIVPISDFYYQLKERRRLADQRQFESENKILMALLERFPDLVPEQSEHADGLHKHWVVTLEVKFALPDWHFKGFIVNIGGGLSTGQTGFTLIVVEGGYLLKVWQP